MSIKKFLIAWHVFAFTYLVVFVFLMGVFPELKVFSFLTKKYGFIDIEDWDFFYLVFVSLAALIFNNMLILVTFRLSMRLKRGN